MPVPGLPRPVVAYNFAAVRVTIGAVALSNYGPDGGIVFEFPSALLESEVSADGFVVYSSMNDERTTATITLRETSGAIPLLMALIRAQTQAVGAGGAITPVPFQMVDPATGDTVGSEYTVFLNEAPPSKAKTVGVREFSIELPYARHRIQHGTLNQPTP